MKRICHLLICFLFIPLLFATTALAQAQPSFDVDAPVAMLMVPKTGQILYAKEVDRQLPPASIAKVMTMLLAMEAVEEGRVSLEDEVRVSAFAESMGHAGAIVRHADGIFEGGNDPRSDGVALGW